MANSISVTVLTKNSQQHLSTCLSALQDFDEVIVLDNGSTDNSIAIARQFQNVKVVESPFIGFGPLKNLAAQHASNSWILSIDSDEVLTEELKEELLKLELTSTDKVYRFRRNNYYRNRLIKACGWDNDYVLRLYNKSVTGFEDLQVHEYIRTEGLQVDLLSGILHHNSYDSISQLILKSNSYTSLFASENRFRKKSSPFKSCYKWAFAFFKNYFLQRGFLYGYEGLTIAFTNAAGAFYKYMKLYEANQTLRISLVFTKPLDKTEWEAVKISLARQQVHPAEIIAPVTDTGPSVSKTEIFRIKDTFTPVQYFHSLNNQSNTAILQETRALVTGEFVVIADNVTALNSYFLKDLKRKVQKGAFSCVLSSTKPTTRYYSIGVWKEDLDQVKLPKAQPEGADIWFDTLVNQLLQNGIRQV